MTDLLALLLNNKHSSDEFECLKHSIQENIKVLIASRQSPDGEQKQLDNSLYSYGLSSRYIGRSSYQHNLLCREIEQLLAQFETRLYCVKVVADSSKVHKGILLLRIEGMIMGVTHPVVFESVFDLISVQLEFEEDGCV